MKQLLRSFRLRIALLSATLAGSTLVGFGAVSWFQIYNAKISRLDAELLNHLLRASRPPEREFLPVTPEVLPKPRWGGVWGVGCGVWGRDSPNNQRVKSPALSGRLRWNSAESSSNAVFTTPYTLPPTPCSTPGLGTDTKIPIAIIVLDTKGNTLYEFNSLPADTGVKRLLVQRLELTPAPPPLPRKPPFRPPLPQFVTAHTAITAWRIGAAKFPHTQVAFAMSLQAVTQEMASIRNIFLVSIPGALLLVAVGAWFVSGGALRPIRQLTGVIQQVTVKGLDQRIPTETTDGEFVELIQVFNQMLERLERSFTQASRFSADAAHELKTPLTILQGELERSLQQVEPGSEVQQRLSNLLDEVHRLSGIMRKLLLLSLADAGRMSLYLVEVNMSELLLEMVEDVELLAPHLSVKSDIPANLKVQGDRDLLIQVLQNLLSNAIKYNLPDGWIQIHANQTLTTLQITITNASKDIPKSDRDQLFDRFYRGDRAHTRQIEGIGLGLSLAREIARAHHGNLVLDSTTSHQTAFTLTLPMRSL